MKIKQTTKNYMWHFTLSLLPKENSTYKKFWLGRSKTLFWLISPLDRDKLVSIEDAWKKDKDLKGSAKDGTVSFSSI